MQEKKNLYTLQTKYYALRGIISLLILAVLLNGCAKKSYNRFDTNIILPEMPIAGSKVAAELVIVCDQEKCANTIYWLNELHLFRQQYLIYKEELNNAAD